jgi:hypothetical protein
VAKTKKCHCICCHKINPKKAKRKRVDLDGILWSIYVCKICGHEFCEKSDGTGDRKEPKDLMKKEEVVNIF